MTSLQMLVSPSATGPSALENVTRARAQAMVSDIVFCRAAEVVSILSGILFSLL